MLPTLEKTNQIEPIIIICPTDLLNNFLYQFFLNNFLI